MPRRTITLDMDETAVRLLETVGTRVVRWATAPLEPGLLADGRVLDPAALGSRIRELVRGGGFRGGEVLASLGGVDAWSRVLRLPGRTTGNLSEAVLQGLGQVLPVPLEQVYLSWQLLSADATEQQVLVVAMPRDVVDPLTAALRAAGLRPAVLIPKAMAIATAANQGDSVVVNVESKTVDIAVVVSGVLRAVHTITKQQDSLSPAQSAQQVTAFLARVLDFYNTQHALEPIAPSASLVVAGQAGAEPEFLRALAKGSNQSVEPLSPPLDYPPHFPVAEYGVNLGLALRVSGAHRGESLALRPMTANLVPQRQRWYTSRRFVLSCLVLLAGFVLVVYLVNQVLTPVQQKSADLQQKVTAREGQRIVTDRTNTRRTELQAQIAGFDQLGAERGRASDVMVRMQELLLPGMAMVSLSYTETAVGLQVEAPSFEALEEYLQLLRDTGLFAAVSSPQQSGAARPGEKLSLSIQADLKKR